MTRYKVVLVPFPFDDLARSPPPFVKGGYLTARFASRVRGRTPISLARWYGGESAARAGQGAGGNIPAGIDVARSAFGQVAVDNQTPPPGLPGRYPTRRREGNCTDYRV